jgi:hypothetical protein
MWKAVVVRFFLLNHNGVCRTIDVDVNINTVLEAALGRGTSLLGGGNW